MPAAIAFDRVDGKLLGCAARAAQATTPVAAERPDSHRLGWLESPPWRTQGTRAQTHHAGGGTVPPVPEWYGGRWFARLPRLPLLLIGTTVATWDDELVERLTGRFVIRYDLRDTGRSATVDPDSPAYTLRDSRGGQPDLAE